MMTKTSDAAAMTMAGLNLIPQALSVYDSQLRLVVCNARFRSLFKLPEPLLTQGAMFEDTIRHLVERGEYGPVDDIEAFVQERVDLARAFEPHYLERQLGNGRWISVEGAPLPQGGWVTVYTDITETKRQEELLRMRSESLSSQLLDRAEALAATNRKLEATVKALEEAKRQLMDTEARTRLTAEMMPAHIARIGRDLRYTYSNRRVSSVMPDSMPDPVGELASDVLGAQPWKVLEPQIARAFSGESPVFEFTHEFSSRRIRVALTPDSAGDGVYVLSMDVTEETQARTALQQTRRRELAAQVVSGLAHDFSNLLTIVLGSQSRLSKMNLSPEGEDLVNTTLTAARRGGDLLNRIANMTHGRGVRTEPVWPAQFIDQFRTFASSALPDGITLKTQVDMPDTPVLLDTGMLQDALLNLVLNARDACGAKGAIGLSLRTVKNTWIEFVVSDNGSGFSEAALARAFDPFFTTKGDNGTGLGLAMVYDMVKLSGGRSFIRNTDAGANVILQLPLRKVATAKTPGLALLVEDRAEIRADVREMLIALGHNVIEASSAEEALELAKAVPEISLILSDVSLEGEMTGVDLLEELAPLGIPARLMTSLQEADPLYARAARTAPILRKPFDAATLARTLKLETTS